MICPTIFANNRLHHTNQIMIRVPQTAWSTDLLVWIFPIFLGPTGSGPWIPDNDVNLTDLSSGVCCIMNRYYQ